ncbi:TetR family transcriptional regulator [Alphaproteobacteria bacterium GH1-50]|uniref:TetR family transcriptional regulator n=1 Tax=Kangsaoukella pontilimi TaxID=2691042 RepID=A0A7C9IHS9_9RHOB|nr:TetR/AcrR family transcriptional regulator [Kangsaoukella pontilimi]MXQ07902.1 TetR family transcriptional regulator [Kangsaoukella pontilimi]
MPKRNGEMVERILAVARDIVREDGPDNLTFDRVAARVGVSKQAIIYWFPNKARLVEALVRPALEAEAAAGKAALRADTTNAGHAIRAFVEALAAFHVSDLDRFRLMYVTPQIGQRPGRSGAMLTTLGRIHPATTEMYDALAERLVAAGRYGRVIDARRAATAIHTALLGLLLRMAMADTLDAPLRHRDHALIDALLGVLTPEAA